MMDDDQYREILHKIEDFKLLFIKFADAVLKALDFTEEELEISLDGEMLGNHRDIEEEL